MFRNVYWQESIFKTLPQLGFEGDGFFYAVKLPGMNGAKWRRWKVKIRK
jgi:hypothetical protein